MSKSKTRFDISDKDIAELFHDNFQEKKIIPWKTNGVYKVWFNIRRFFRNPYPKEKKELDLLDVVDLLISTADPKNVTESCKQYVDLHRIVENTRARRRLERWVQGSSLRISSLSSHSLLPHTCSSGRLAVALLLSFFQPLPSILLLLA